MDLCSWQKGLRRRKAAFLMGVQNTQSQCHYPARHSREPTLATIRLSRRWGTQLWWYGQILPRKIKGRPFRVSCGCCE